MSASDKSIPFFLHLSSNEPSSCLIFRNFKSNQIKFSAVKDNLQISTAPYWWGVKEIWDPVPFFSFLGAARIFFFLLSLEKQLEGNISTTIIFFSRLNSPIKLWSSSSIFSSTLIVNIFVCGVRQSEISSASASIKDMQFLYSCFA